MIILAAYADEERCVVLMHCKGIKPCEWERLHNLIGRF
jgi:hypothetical protein